MLELFAYPVSALIKLWHIILSDLISMDPVTAWVWSILGLVITIRLLIMPLTWMSKRSAKVLSMMRPELAELKERYGSSAEREDIIALQDGQKDLYNRYGYSLSAGCIPPLIQIPVLLGLYRVLMWMSRPETLEGDDSGVGVLSGADVSQFLEASLFGIPLQAYINMAPEKYDALGVTPDQVQRGIVPLLFAAVIFTTINMLISQWWTIRHLDWSSSVARGMVNFIWWMVIIAPLMLLVFGILGPIPMALVLYWFLSNLWTLGQTIVMNAILLRRYQETDSHRNLRATHKQAYQEEVAKQRARKKEDRTYIASAPSRGQTKAEAKAEIESRTASEEEERKSKKAAEKARRQAISQVRAEITRENAAKRNAERAAKKKKD